MLYLASCLASAYHGAPLAPHSRIITMQQVTEKAPAVAPVANGAAAAPAPKSSPPASKVDAMEPVVPLCAPPRPATPHTARSHVCSRCSLRSSLSLLQG